MSGLTPPSHTNPPRGVPPVPLSTRQLDAEMIRLQRAATSAHRSGQLVESLRTVGSLALALAGVVLTAVEKGSTAVALTGLIWAVVAAALGRASSHSSRTAALIQEQFDTALFYMPWRSSVAGEPIASHDIAQLEKKVERGSVADKRITDGWYDPTDGLHHPLDVLVTQEQNLAWDSRLRRRYALSVLTAAGVWTLLGLGLCLATDSIVGPLLTFFVPSLGAYTLAAETWKAQTDVAEERERLGDEVKRQLAVATGGPIGEAEYRRLRNIARDIQDGILRTRTTSSRVPEWFYKRHRTTDESDFQATVDEHRRRLT